MNNFFIWKIKTKTLANKVEERSQETNNVKFNLHDSKNLERKAICFVTFL